MSTHAITPDTLTTIVRSGTDGSLRLRRRRRRDDLGARVLAHRLDARLAEGVAPESGRLLAARAAFLVDPATCRRLAEAWEQVLARATRPTTAVLDPRVPVARNDVVAASADIEALLVFLRSDAPLAAQDVARARALLTDGAGPVYVEGRGLRAAVRDVTATRPDRPATMGR